MRRPASDCASISACCTVGLSRAYALGWSPSPSLRRRSSMG
ncbi:Uncharacterised protein [Bordetella pertussis]|nr:Uncharacterised protein [Bordetella pertussis]